VKKYSTKKTGDNQFTVRHYKKPIAIITTDKDGAVATTKMLFRDSWAALGGRIPANQDFSNCTVDDTAQEIVTLFKTFKMELRDTMTNAVLMGVAGGAIQKPKKYLRNILKMHRKGIKQIEQFTKDSKEYFEKTPKGGTGGSKATKVSKTAKEAVPA